MQAVQPSPAALRGYSAPSPAAPQTAPLDGAGSSTSAGLAAAGVFAAVAAVSTGGRRTTRTARRVFGLGGATQDTRPLAIPDLVPAYRRVIRDPWAREIDAGFDPLNLATSQSPFGGKANPQETYFNYREAEVKHGRLAMLATLGWVSSEAYGPAIARQLGLQDLLAPGELAPSVINGGLGNLPFWFLPSIFIVSGIIDRNSPKPELYGEKRVPGDVGFDPLGAANALKVQSGRDMIQLHNAEVKHGRAAMIGITVFVLQEFFFRIPVIKEDEMAADIAVRVVDKGIEAFDKAAGVAVPEIPLPFPNI